MNSQSSGRTSGAVRDTYKRNSHGWQSVKERFVKGGIYPIVLDLMWRKTMGTQKEACLRKKRGDWAGDTICTYWVHSKGYGAQKERKGGFHTPAVVATWLGRFPTNE